MERKEVYQTKNIELKIGQTVNNQPFGLPLDAATQKFAFLARSGAGKTYAASLMAELMYNAGTQIVVLDPVGVWYGLRLAADGKGPGLSIPVFGGEYGDIPLEPGAGALVADVIVDRNVSLILDVSHFRKGQRKEFVTAFAEQLFHRKKKARSPVHFFLEEAQFFVPQKTFKGEERMLGAFEDIGKVGRNYGIGLTLISQRPQAINKDVLNQSEALFVLQMNGSQERKAIRDWIDAQGIDTGAAIDDLPNLAIGEAYIWSPQWLKFFGKVKIGQKQTYNASATPTFNTKSVIPRALAPADLEALHEAMRSTIETTKGQDPARLKQRILELEKELGRRPAETKIETRTRIEQVEIPVIKDEQIEQLKQAINSLTDATGGLTGLAEGLAEVTRRLQDSFELFVTWKRSNSIEKPNQSKPAEPKKPDLPKPIPQNGSIQLRAGEIKMLRVLATHPGGLTRIQLATLAGYASKGGTYNTYLSILRTNSLIEESGGRTRITAAGLGCLGSNIPSGPQTTEEIVQVWGEALRSGERKMLDILIEQYPDSLNRQDLADQAGYESGGGTFNTYLSTLRRNNLIEVDGREIRASGVFFLN